MSVDRWQGSVDRMRGSPDHGGGAGGALRSARLYAPGGSSYRCEDSTCSHQEVGGNVTL